MNAAVPDRVYRAVRSATVIPLQRRAEDRALRSWRDVVDAQRMGEQMRDQERDEEER